LARAVVASAREVAVPLLIAMLCVLAVFVPAFFMTGTAKAMFLPLSLAVGFSMVASYLLASTVVPVLVGWLGKGSSHSAVKESASGRSGRCRDRYVLLARGVVAGRGRAVGASLAVTALILVVVGPRLGIEIFPQLDTDQLQLRLRAPAGTRIERTEQI